MKPGDGAAITRVVETGASWDGVPLSPYPEGAPRVTVLRATVPPHTTLAMHTHALVNAGVILRGELTVISETGAERTFRTGERVSWNWSVRAITARTGATTGRWNW